MGNGSLIVTSLRWNGDEALKLMSRADELEVRETVKMGRCQDMEPNILNTSKHLPKKLFKQNVVLSCFDMLGPADARFVKLWNCQMQSFSLI